VATKLRPTKTWSCSGPPDDPHDTVENADPDCRICGNPEKSEVIKKSPKLPLIRSAIIISISMFLLGSRFLLFPHIPGICDVLTYCSAWDQDITKTQKLVEKTKPLVEKKDSSKGELETALKDINTTIALLTPLSDRNSLKPRITGILSDAKILQTKLEKKISGSEDQNLLDKSQNLIEQKRKIIDKKDIAKGELESILKEVNKTIDLLTPLSDREDLKPKISTVLADAKKLKTEIDRKITSLIPSERSPNETRSPDLPSPSPDPDPPRKTRPEPTTYSRETRPDPVPAPDPDSPRKTRPAPIPQPEPTAPRLDLPRPPRV
jgi:hypothetical protein